MPSGPRECRFIGQKTWECVCPKCRKTHTLMFDFTGRGIPRKYCHQCKNFVIPEMGDNPDALPRIPQRWLDATI